MEKTGSELLVEGLAVEGFRHLFGISGSPLLPIPDALSLFLSQIYQGG